MFYGWQRRIKDTVNMFKITNFVSTFCLHITLVLEQILDDQEQAQD